jgi:hypothetical protein
LDGTGVGDEVGDGTGVGDSSSSPPPSIHNIILHRIQICIQIHTYRYRY